MSQATEFCLAHAEWPTSKMTYKSVEEISLCQHFRTQRIETPCMVSPKVNLPVKV